MSTQNASGSSSLLGSGPGSGQGSGSGTAVSHLVCLFCVTAGQNGENLGSDEEQIVLFIYLLYDVTNNKVVTLQQHHVRPTADDISETVLTEECRIQTGLQEENIKNAQPLEHVLDELERFLCSKEVHPDHGGRPFCFCTDGQLHLRMCLLPEATRKNIQLPAHFNRFFDIRKEFKKFYKTERPINCIKDMLDFLALDDDQSVEYGVRHCQEMASILQRLINDGHLFTEPEIIREKLEPGVCTIDEVVDDETVVRARGLPWQSSDQDIARFFRGLNLAKGGVALCLSQQGRRNGEALVRLETREHRDLALRKHKHHIGQRYIEVYRATGQDFLAVAGGSCSEAQEFLSRHGDGGGQTIVRMRGLPYTCKAEQVIEFFKEGPPTVEVLDGEDGILFVHQADGRSTGDCFVLFGSDEDANKALAKHRQCIGTRYIELFKSTTAEVQQVLNRSLDPRTPTTDELLTPQGAIFTPALFTQFPQTAAHPMVIQNQHMITCGTHRDCIRLRGLLFESTVSDILSFLGEYSRHIVFQGVHLVYNSLGAPSGEAFIQMSSELAAETTALSKNKKMMFLNGKKKPIDVIQCSGQDMNYVLTTGLPVPHIPVAIQSAGPTQSFNTSQFILPPSSQFISATNQRAVFSVASTIPANQHMITQMVLPGSLPGTTTTILTPALPNHITPFTHMTFPATPSNQIPQVYQPILSAATLPPPQTPSINPGAIVPVSVTTNTAAGNFNQQLLPQFHQLLPAGAAPQLRGSTGLSPPISNNVITSSLAPSGGDAAPSYAQYQSTILYWYPSPPVSPQNAGLSYYIQTPLPTTVSMKGLPSNVQAHDIINYLHGLFEITPDVQLVRGVDGQHNGEAYVTFSSRGEAERAVQERGGRKVIGNKLVEIYMM